jgi:hypothetical protein
MQQQELSKQNKKKWWKTVDTNWWTLFWIKWMKSKIEYFMHWVLLSQPRILLPPTCQPLLSLELQASINDLIHSICCSIYQAKGMQCNANYKLSPHHRISSALRHCSLSLSIFRWWCRCSQKLFNENFWCSCHSLLKFIVSRSESGGFEVVKRDINSARLLHCSLKLELSFFIHNHPQQKAINWWY